MIFKFLFLCLFSFYSHGIQVSLSQKWNSQSEKQIEQILNQMTDEDKISLLFVVPFHQTKTWNELVPGGLILHSRVGDEISAEKLIQKINHFQKLSLKKYGKLGFTLTDSEGGIVSRLSRKRHRPFNGSSYYDLVSPYMMAQTKKTQLATEMGSAIGDVLYSLGINMNVAPVVDLADPQKKSYMSERVFGSNPYLVQKFSQAYNKGLYQSKVIGVFKHFPGYGETQTNTHTSTFESSFSKEQLLKKDIIPYQSLGEEGEPQAILTNIGLYTKLDSENTAPLSSKIVQGFIRKEMNFKGLVITDALNMKGFKEKNFIQKVIKSFVAGNDLALIYGSSYRESMDAHQAVLNALNKGVLKKETLNTAVKRVLLFKSYLSSVHEESLEKRLLNYRQKLDVLYGVNQKVIQQNLDHFFEKNNHLKNILSKDLNVAVFSSDSFYENFEKSLEVFKSSTHAKYLLQKNYQHERKDFLDKLKQKNYVTFCYGSLMKRCKNMEKSVKKRMILIKTKPHYSVNENEYLAVIPVYGQALEVGSLVLKMLLKRHK